jgi:Tol biopolymer transport system component
MRVVIAVALGLALAVAVLSVTSARLGPSVDSMMTARTFDGTVVNSQFALTFSTPMDTRSVERAFRVSPRIGGTFTWSGNTLLFAPERPLRYGARYVLTIGTGARDKTGRHLFRAFRRTITTQQEHLLYLGAGRDGGRLVLASLGGMHRLIGPNDGSITGFSLSYDRSLAVYTRRGGPHERSDEIWVASVTDESAQRVLRRPDWNISQAHLSPDGRTMTFLATHVRLCRKFYGCYVDSTSPVIELLDMRSHRVSIFAAGSDTPITDFINFSPSGQLAYTDLGSALTLARPNGGQVVHIPNQGNSLQFVTFDPSGNRAAFVGQTADSTGGDVLVYSGSKYLDVSQGIYDSSTPSFSSSGSRIAYAAYRGEKGIEPIYGINVYDFKTRRTTKLTASREWSDWAPDWSSDDGYIAFVRTRPEESMYMGSGRVYVIRSDGTGARPVGSQGNDVQWTT